MQNPRGVIVNSIFHCVWMCLCMCTVKTRSTASSCGYFFLHLQTWKDSKSSRHCYSCGKTPGGHPGTLARRRRRQAARLRCVGWYLGLLRRLMWWASGEDLDLVGVREAFGEVVPDASTAGIVGRERGGSAVQYLHFRPAPINRSGRAPRSILRR